MRVLIRTLVWNLNGAMREVELFVRFGTMCIHTGSHILLALTEVSETQPALASGYKSDNALERSWQQLGAKLLQQFWEHGFLG